jgi:L-ascorbate metabolism protein UlaG (beta-lactamase superfamily)
MRVTYVGHSTVSIELDGVRVLTDPVLRGRFLHVERRAPAVDRAAIGQVDVVLISHAHHDHLDRPSLRELDAATVVAPDGAGRHVPHASRVIEVGPGSTLSFGGVQIDVTYAAHRPGRLRHQGSPALGYVLTGTRTIYFAGDTDLFPGMREIGARVLDLALLPVWGWGTRIGAGHLDPLRAAEALTSLHPRFAIPIHWGTFYPLGLRRLRPHLLTEPPHAFAREAARLAPDVQVRVLAPGQSAVLP